MSLQENKSLIRRYVEELNHRNISVLNDVVADEVTLSSLHPSSVLEKVSRHEYRQQIMRRIAAFPDYHVKVEEMIAEGDRVVICWTHRGTHKGEYLGVPPTGKQIIGSAVSIYRLIGGRIAEVRGLWDKADWWQQLGLIPDESEIVPARREASGARNA